MDELSRHPAAESSQTENHHVCDRVTATWKQGWEKSARETALQELTGGELGGGAERGGCWRWEGAELNGGKLEPTEPKGFQELECQTVSRELLAPLSAVFTSANGSKSYSIVFQ